MATDVPMPKLGLTMEEAMIVEWLVADGELVEPDTPIMRIETDKTETEVGSPGAGRLQQLGKAGDVFACGVRVAVLLAEGETAVVSAPPVAAAMPPPSTAMRGGPAPAVAAPAAALHDARLLASPNARRVAAERGLSLAGIRGTGPNGRIVSEDLDEVRLPSLAPAGAPPSSTGFVVASVAARNLADLLGIDLAQVAPDPVEHRVTRDGVALHVRQRLQTVTTRPVDEPTAVTAAWPLLQEPTEVLRLTGMRGTIAKRMQASLREMAQLTLTMDADMTAVLHDRSERKAADPSLRVPSITDYVMAAAARALVRHPRMNAQVTEAGIALLPEVHVGLAVALDNGLVVPVVRDAAHRALDDLATETSRLAAAARGGSISPAELEGGTFSVSALGAAGVDAFTPVINPPNAGILGVGRLRDDVILVDGHVAAVKRLTLSLTWDHRVLDGVPAAEFCRTVVELLADPVTLD